MQISGEISRDVEAGKVWQVLGKNFGTPHLWVSSVESAKVTGSSVGSALCDGRVCQTSLGEFTERIEHYGSHFLERKFLHETMHPAHLRQQIKNRIFNN